MAIKGALTIRRYIIKIPRWKRAFSSGNKLFINIKERVKLSAYLFRELNYKFLKCCELLKLKTELGVNLLIR